MSLEGQQLGQYQILHVIGSRGMGEVYLAQDHRIHRQVAIKIIELQTPEQGSEVEEKARQLFLNEVKTIAQLDYPGILPLYDYGEEIIAGTSCAYLITPYRAEGSLSTWLRTRGQHQQMQQLTFKQVVHLIGQAAAALQYAHDHQVIHRDVKPANFLIRSHSKTDEYPDLLLADFSIARLMAGTSSVSHDVRGAPSYSYMAPEQWAGEAVFNSDQYALAVMTYELLTGSPPFQGAPMSVMYAHLHQIPGSPSKRNPLLQSSVDEVLLRALAKKPEERFASMTAFLQALQAAFQDGDERTTLRALRSSPVPPFAQRTKQSGEIGKVPKSVLTPPQSAASFSASGTPPTASPAPDQLTTTPLIPQPKRARHRRSPVLVGLVTIVLVSSLLGGTIFATQRLLGPGIRWKSWSLGAGKDGDSLSGIVWSKQLSQYVAIGYDPGSKHGIILTSPDGQTWTERYSNLPASLMQVIWTGSQYVGVGDNMVVTSPDGQTWTFLQSKDGSGPGSLSFPMIEWLKGVTWTGSEYVAVTDIGIVTSPDGQYWTSQASGPSVNLTAIIWTGSQYVVVGGPEFGDHGTIATSPDGQNWTPRTSGASVMLTAIIWTGSQYVVVGDHGTILTSTDGRTWTSRTSGTSEDLTAIAWSGSRYVVAGDAGTILTSPDGQTWTSQTSGTSGDLTAISWSGSQFVAVGGGPGGTAGGTILTSS